MKMMYPQISQMGAVFSQRDEQTYAIIGATRSLICENLRNLRTISKVWRNES